MLRLQFSVPVRKREQNTLQLQHSSSIKTVAKQVNSFQHCLSQQLHRTRRFFYYFATPLRVSTRYVPDRSTGEFRFAYETYHILLFRKIRTYADVFYFSVYAYPRAMVLASTSCLTHALRSYIHRDGTYDTSIFGIEATIFHHLSLVSCVEETKTVSRHCRCLQSIICLCSFVLFHCIIWMK